MSAQPADAPLTGDDMRARYLSGIDDLARTTIDTVHVSWSDRTPREQKLLVALDFYREHVAQSRPCLITGLMAQWPALTRWRDNAYVAGVLDAAAGGPATQHLTIACTPNGRADAITRVAGGNSSPRTLFMSPAERKMSAAELFRALEASARNCPAPPKNPYDVDIDAAREMFVYAQLQNDCLNSEYAALKGDVGASVSEFGKMVFGVEPDAANVWIGNSLSVTSMHQDWYENLYAVVRGEKHFTLVAPWEAPLLSKAEAPNATYVWDGDQNGARWRAEIAADGATTPWIDVDIVDDELSGDAAARLLHPISFSAGPGEVVYLPATWFHRVAQKQMSPDDPSDCVIAANFWFDMSFGAQTTLCSVVNDVWRPLFHNGRKDGAEKSTS